MICGEGGQPGRKGGVGGMAPALLAMGYVWDTGATLGMAHLWCVNQARAALKKNVK